jgi:hypothetical protein
MLRLILSLAAVLIVAVSLTSRLSEVRAAGTKPNTGIKSSRGTIATVEVGTLSGTVCPPGTPPRAASIFRKPNSTCGDSLQAAHTCVAS